MMQTGNFRVKGYRFIILLAFVLAAFCGTAAAAGELDSSFQGGVAQIFGDVRAAVIQPDGKVLIAGKWIAIDDKPFPIIARFNTDGSRDLSFNPATITVCCLADLSINDMVLQPDGKIIIAGGFLGVGGSAHQLIARLNSDGSVDNSFAYGANEGVTASGPILDLELLPDGKVMAAGTMTYASVSRNSLVRFNSNGTMDMSFNPGTAQGCFAAKVLADGKVLASCRSSNTYFIKKFNTDGTADPSFLTSTSSTDSSGGFARGIVVLPDGKYFIHGFFDQVNNTSRGSVSKLNTDGTLDMSFNPKGTGFTGDVRSVIVEPDGQLVAAGRFGTYNGTTVNTVVRINTDGSLDSSLNYDPVYFGQYATRVVLQGDGKYFVTGVLTRNVLGDLNSRTGGFLRRINDNGSNDNSFTSVYSEDVGGNAAMLQQPDGKILVGGKISVHGRRFVNNLIRFNVDGSPDLTFNAAIDPNKLVTALQMQPDNKILVALMATGLPVGSLIRLNSDGSVDAGFTGQVGPGTPSISDIVVLPGGKILISGFINNRIISRLNTDGSLDNTFDNGASTSFGATKMAVLPSGKIIIAGQFTSVGGVPRGRIARLNADGSLDNTFNPPVGADNTIASIAVQSDGKILIAGYFNNYNTTSHKYIARLTSEGALDPTFADPGISNSTPAPGYTVGISAMKLLPNGNVVISGLFDALSGNSSHNVARLTSTGAWDSTFNVGSGTNAPVIDMALQSNGRILIGGPFTSYKGQPVLGIARLMNGNAAFDFDGDGRSDIGVFRPSDGNWYLAQSTSGFSVQHFGVSGDRVTSADYDGDGKSDLAIYRNGDWWYVNSSNGSLGLKSWGTSSDIALPSDFDGDGKADFIYYRPSTGEWFRSGSLGVNSTVQFGIGGDIPVSGDFDGDGKADPAIFRPSNGQWWYQSSATGSAVASQWGQSGDVPVAADYDGDGRADIAVWRPSNGAWYIYNSSNGAVSIFGWGLAEDKPVAADYDGDGRADIAVWRPSSGVWYIMQSTAGFTGMQYGLSSDKPVPNAFLP